MIRDKASAFWEKVDKQSECWEWTWGTSESGYGRFYWNYRQLRAHRVAYELCIGEVPEGLEVCHSCNNPLCVNPEHLFLGTHKQNMEHMSVQSRGARLRGETNGNSRLSNSQAAKIKQRYEAGGISQRALAAEYGVSQGTVWQIVTGKQYRGD